jgi:Mg-chelatase subunit ChlI
MEASVQVGSTEVIELHVDGEDAFVVASRLARAMPRFRGRIVVHSHTEPGGWPLLAVLEAVGVGRVRWLFASAGGVGDDDQSLADSV